MFWPHVEVSTHIFWMQKKFLSLRAVHILGQLNLGADFHFLHELRPGEWRVHPQTAREEVDLLYFKQDSTVLPLDLSFSSFASVACLFANFVKIILNAFLLVSLLDMYQLMVFLWGGI